jgi:hypothetical protein
MESISTTCMALKVAASAKIIFDPLMATAFGKNVPKCGAQCIGCSREY